MNGLVSGAAASIFQEPRAEPGGLREVGAEDVPGVDGPWDGSCRGTGRRWRCAPAGYLPRPREAMALWPRGSIAAGFGTRCGDRRPGHDPSHGTSAPAASPEEVIWAAKQPELKQVSDRHRRTRRWPGGRTVVAGTRRGAVADT